MLNLDYNELYPLSNSHPEGFWDELAQQVIWDKPYTCVIDDKELPIPKWFIGGEINMSYNCLDKAIEEGYGDDVAVIYESPATKTTEKITFKQLLQSVELLAGMMVDKCGMKKGDMALMYFPVIPQGLIGMLACTRIGVIYSPMFGGYSSRAISTRINHIQPKLILTCNLGFESFVVVNYKQNVDQAIEMSEFIPEHCIVYNRPNTEAAKMIDNRDLEWTNEMRVARPQKPIPVESNHPMFIIYTSGTTGEPKGLVMITGNSVVTNKYQMKYVFGLKPRECFWMYSDYGWITGQSIMTYGPLLMRCSTILYEGHPINTPDSGQIARILNRNEVVSFMLSPTFMRILRNNCNESDVKLTYLGLRAIYIAGEVSDSDLKQWISKTFKCPLNDLWSQTEISSAGMSPGYGFNRDNYSKSIIMPSFIPVIVNSETGEILPNETPGRLLLKKPFIPSMATTFYKNHDRFLKTYFQRYPGYFDTMDYAVLIDGNLRILSRADDVIQVASGRVCGGAVEEICLQNENVIDAAVVPLDNDINGQVPFAYLVKKKGQDISDQEIIAKTVELVNKSIGEFILFKHAVIVPDFPKTKTGKISRYSLGNMVNGKEYKLPLNVDNVEIYRIIHQILTNSGYGATLPIELI